MNTLAPEFSALMIILRSTGPVISTRRSSRSAGIGATRQSPSRMARVSAQEIGRLAGVERFWRVMRAAPAIRAGARRNVGAGRRGRRARRASVFRRSAAPAAEQRRRRRTDRSGWNIHGGPLRCFRRGSAQSYRTFCLAISDSRRASRNSDTALNFSEQERRAGLSLSPHASRMRPHPRAPRGIAPDAGSGPRRAAAR